MSENLSTKDYVEGLVKQAKAAAARLATLSTAVKDQALLAMAEALIAKSDEIIAANEQDVHAMESGNKAMADRLRLTPERIAEMAAGIREVAKLPRSEEHTSELQSPTNLVCRLLLE